MPESGLGDDYPEEVRAFLWALDLETAAMASESDSQRIEGVPVSSLWRIDRIHAQEALAARYAAEQHGAVVMRLAYDLVAMEMASVRVGGTAPRKARSMRLALIAISGVLLPIRESSPETPA